MPDTIQILIADNHPVVVDGLKKLIEGQPDMTIIGEASDGQETVRKVRLWKPDVLLLDLPMSRLSGFDVLRKLFQAKSLVKTIIFTAEIEEQQAIEALRCGARGIVLKDTATELLFKAIRRVMEGEYWIGRENVSRLVDALRNPMVGRGAFGLSRRELEIVSAIQAGCTNKAIAQKLGITDQTVKNHLTTIFNKTGTWNRLELALFAADHQLFVPDQMEQDI